MASVKYRCAACGGEYPVDTPVFRCAACGGFLEVDGAGIFPRSELKNRGRGIWRYFEAFGLPAGAVRVSMGEGGTPVVTRRFDGESLRLKLDFMQPTGSFKDRGASVLLSLASNLGVKEVCEDSSGNAGAAVSAYGAAAGIRCAIFVPGYTPEDKVTQIRMYGAEVIKVEGTRQDTNEAAVKRAGECFYASHLWHPFFTAGLKSAAYEIWEAADGEVPDTVVVPVGSGGFLEGLYLGFDSLVRAGYADRMPRMIGVQSAACTPIHTAFIQKRDDYADIEAGVTVAEGIAVQRPPRSRAVLSAIAKSGGRTVAVDDGEIMEAARRLSGSGIYVEPTSASTLAGWLKLDPVERRNALLVLTGSGLKATGRYGHAGSA